MMQRLRGKLVTVTGGLGFVGRSLIRKLLEYGARVTILDHHLENSHRFVDRLFLDKVKFVHADTARLTDPGSIITETDLIYALAGRSGAADSLVHPLEDLEANCVGHLTLLEGARLFNPSVRVVFRQLPQFRVLKTRKTRLSNPGQ